MTARVKPVLEPMLTIPEAAKLAGVPRSTMMRRLRSADQLVGGGLLFRMSQNGRWYVTRSTLARHLPGLLPHRGATEDEAAELRDRIATLEAVATADARRLREHSTLIRELQREVADFRAKSHAWFTRAK